METQGPQNSLDHGKRPLHHDRDAEELQKNGNCGTSTVFCTPNPPGTCHCTPTGMSTTCETGFSCATGTSTIKCMATVESRRPRGFASAPQQERRRPDELHDTMSCRVPPWEQWRRTPLRTCAQTCPKKCSHLHPKDQDKSQSNTELALCCRSQQPTHRKTGTRRPTRRRTRDTTEQVVPEVGKHAHENGSRLRSCREGREEVRGSRRFLLFFVYLLTPAEDEDKG